MPVWLNVWASKFLCLQLSTLDCRTLTSASHQPSAEPAYLPIFPLVSSIFTLNLITFSHLLVVLISMNNCHILSLYSSLYLIISVVFLLMQSHQQQRLKIFLPSCRSFLHQISIGEWFELKLNFASLLSLVLEPFFETGSFVIPFYLSGFSIADEKEHRENSERLSWWVIFHKEGAANSLEQAMCVWLSCARLYGLLHKHMSFVYLHEIQLL